MIIELTQYSGSSAVPMPCVTHGLIANLVFGIYANSNAHKHRKLNKMKRNSSFVVVVDVFVIRYFIGSGSIMALISNKINSVWIYFLRCEIDASIQLFVDSFVIFIPLIFVLHTYMPSAIESEELNSI